MLYRVPFTQFAGEASGSVASRLYGFGWVSARTHTESPLPPSLRLAASKFPFRMPQPASLRVHLAHVNPAMMSLRARRARLLQEWLTI